MIPAVEQLYELAAVLNWVLWLIMFSVAVVVLVYVSNYFTGESPQTLFRAVRTTAVVVAVVFFTYDVAGYLFALLMQDPTNGIRMPEHYTYWDWLREPIGLKWHVLGYVPIIRYIPIVFAVVAGSVAQVFLLDVPYHVGVVVFLTQLFLDFLALVVLSFVFNFGIGIYVRNVVEPALIRARVEAIRKTLDRADRRERPETLAHLKDRVRDTAPEQGPFWRQVEAQWSSVNGNLEPLYGALRPFTRHLPLPAQDFLEGGGWLVAIPGLAALALFWPRIHRGRKQMHHRRRKRRPTQAAAPRRLLSEVGECFTGLGAKQLSVRGNPGRLRLVVLAPPAAGGEAPPDGSHGPLLEAAVRGLGEVAGFDFPKVETWTDRQARENFRAAFVEGVKAPEAQGEPSPWVLLTGTVVTPRGPHPLGLAVLTEKATAERVIEVPEGGWAAVLAVRDVPADEQGL
jgi:hypothetical protein